MSDREMEIYNAAYNHGLRDAVNIIRQGVHSAAFGMQLGGIQDDDDIIIAAILRLVRK